MNDFEQRIVGIKKNYRKNYKRYKFRKRINSNLIDFDNDNLVIDIPITVNQLYIKEIVNVSDYEDDDEYGRINAIIIRLDGNSGIDDDTVEPVKLIKANIKISKITGLSKDTLIKHNILKVLIFHDDESFLENNYLNDFKKYVKKYGYLPNYPHCIKEKKPKEEGGDIIIGG